MTPDSLPAPVYDSPYAPPYHSSTHLVGYSLRDEKDSRSDLGDDFDDDSEFSHRPHDPYSHSPAYPPVRKPSKASSLDVDDILQSYEEDLQPPARPEKDIDDVPKSSLIRSFIPSSLVCRLYLLVALVETFVDVAIEVALWFRLRAASNDQADASAAPIPVYVFLFGLAHAYQFILAVDAVRSRNMLQIFFLAVFNALFILYSILQITEIQSAVPAGTPGIISIPINVVVIIIPAVITVAEIAYLVLSWRMYREFGWQVYKLLGADVRIKRMYLHWQVFICFLKFDVYFWIGFSVQFIFLVVPHTSIEYPLTIAALPVALLLLLEGYLAARFENRWLMGSFMLGTVAGVVYFSYKMVKIIIEYNGTSATSNVREDFKTITIFSASCIALLLLTFAWATIVMCNFGRGLKRQLGKSKRTLDPVPRSRVVNGDVPFKGLNRMSLD